MNILAFDTCLDKTYVTLSRDKDIIKSEVILSDGENYHSAYLISTIVKILKEAGYGMENVLKTTVFLQDMNDFAAMNAVYETFFTDPYPARAAFQVAKLPKGAKVEIEAVAK